jgi:hypothetical protein
LLLDINNNKIAKIDSKYTIPFLQVKYIVTFKNDLFEILPKSFFSPYFILDYKGSNYEIIKHKGLRYSIFKDSRQIGYFSKDSVSFGAAKVFQIEIDNDADINLICTFVYALCCNFESSAEINIDLGLVLKEYKQFDKDWKAKK